MAYIRAERTKQVSRICLIALCVQEYKFDAYPQSMLMLISFKAIGPRIQHYVFRFHISALRSQSSFQAIE